MQYINIYMCLLCFSHIYFSSSSPQFNYLSLRIRIYKVMSSLAFGACRQRQIRHETTTYPSGLYKKKKKGKNSTSCNMERCQCAKATIPRTVNRGRGCIRRCFHAESQDGICIRVKNVVVHYRRVLSRNIYYELICLYTNV